jgi:hypothetical protein
MNQKPKYLGTIKCEQGSLQIKRKLTGRDLYKALEHQKEGRMLSALLSSVCYLNNAPITISQADELESGVSEIVQQEASQPLTLESIQTDKYPHEYKLTGDDFCKKVEVVEPRKIKHDNKCLRLAKNKPEHLAFWLIIELIEIDDKKILFDDLLDMPSSVSQNLIQLIIPKKFTFVPAKK